MSTTSTTGRHVPATGKHVAAPAPKRDDRPKAAPRPTNTDAPAKRPQKATAAPQAKKTEKARPAPAPATEPKTGVSRRDIILACILIIVVVLITAALFLRDASARSSYESYYMQAVSSYELGDYEASLANLRHAVAIEKTDDCVMLMVDCYEALGNLDKALELLRQLDTRDSSVQLRISMLESKRDAQNGTDRIQIAGQDFDPGATVLVLTNAGVGDAELQQITQLYALTTLTLSDNEISDLSPLASLGGLTTLDLRNNHIRDLSPLAGLTGLRSLYLDGNEISDFSPLYNLKSLTMLSIRGMELTETQLSDLSRVLPNCAIHSEDVVTEVQDISIGGVTFKADVTTLDLSNLGLTDISALSACRKLTRLDLSGNSISDLSPLTDIPGLSWLSIKNNNVSDLRPLMSLTSLRTLNAQGNRIRSTVPLSTLKGLVELYLSYNPITDFSGLGKLSALDALQLDDTGLTDEGLDALKTLSSMTQLTILENASLSGDAVDKLKAALPKCKISHDTLVYTSEIGGRRYRQDLTELDLSYVGAFDLSELQKFKQLETLSLRSDGLVDISELRWLRTVKSLDLANNDIVDLAPLSFLSGLEKLDLSYNNISDLTPLQSLTMLKELRILGNYLTEEQKDELRYKLPGCTITFEE